MAKVWNNTAQFIYIIDIDVDIFQMIFNDFGYWYFVNYLITLMKTVIQPDV